MEFLESVTDRIVQSKLILQGEVLSCTDSSQEECLRRLLFATNKVYAPALKKRIAGYEFMAVVMIFGLAFTLVSMRIMNAPAEVLSVLLLIFGGIIALTFVDHMVSYRAPSRSLFERRISGRLTVWLYFIGLTILAICFVGLPTLEKGEALLNTMRLYGGTIGGTLLTGSLCLAINTWRPKTEPQAEVLTEGVIYLGGGRFTRKQVEDLENGICPRCGMKMTPSPLHLDDAQRYYCSNCAEFFSVRPRS